MFFAFRRYLVNWYDFGIISWNEYLIIMLVPYNLGWFEPQFEIKHLFQAKSIYNGKAWVQTFAIYKCNQLSSMAVMN